MIKDKDDLTRIEGIGTKVEIMLNENGILSFKDLSLISADRLKKLLKDNNMSKFLDPSEWPNKAKNLI